MDKTILRDCLSPMERRRQADIAPTARDLGITKKQASEYLNGLLGTPVDSFDSQGNPIVITLAERLMASKLAWMEQHPDGWKLTELVNASNGNKVQVDVNQSQTAADFFSALPPETEGAVEAEVIGK